MANKIASDRRVLPASIADRSDHDGDDYRPACYSERIQCEPRTGLEDGWMDGIITSWGRILAGYKPSLSIEITRECPLRCPGCYAYGEDHLGGHDASPASRFQGAGADRRRAGPDRSPQAAPCFDRWRRTACALPRARRVLLSLSARGLLHAGRHERGAADSNRLGLTAHLSVVVSIDGLQAEHDVRRAPATYDRILKHIVGQPSSCTAR